MNDIDGADETHYNEAVVTTDVTYTLEKLERKTNSIEESVSCISECIAPTLTLVEDMGNLQKRMDSLQKSHERTTMYLYLLFTIIIVMLLVM